MTTRIVRVVVISPFAAERTALEELLREEGHLVASASGREEGLALAIASRPEVIVADVQLPAHDGVALLRELARHGLPQPILLCPRSNCSLEAAGIVCMTKPIDLAQLCRQLERQAPLISRFA